MRILLIGSGQVGTFAARDLDLAGHDVVTCDANPAPGFFYRFGPRPDSPLLEANLLDISSIERIIRATAPEAVVMTAGLTGADATADPEMARRVNAEAPARLAACAFRNEVPRVVHLSSRSVYGRPDSVAIDESQSTDPISVYGETKLEGERALTEVAASFPRRELCILRSSGVFGPIRFGRGSHSARLMDRLLLAASSDDAVALEGPLSGADEYLYVKDLAQAIRKAVSCTLVQPEVVNIGPGGLTDVSSLATAVELVTGWRPGIVEPKDPSSYRASSLRIEKARELLGYVPSFDLVSGLEDYMRELQHAPEDELAERGVEQ